MKESRARVLTPYGRGTVYHYTKEEVHVLLDVVKHPYRCTVFTHDEIIVLNG